MQSQVNPYHLRQYIQATSLSLVMESPEMKYALELSNKIQDAWHYTSERPRWSNWWDQVSRSSSSVALNIGEAYGRGRGYIITYLLIARGEAYESAASLAIGPPEITDPLKPLCKQLVEAINQRLLSLNLDKK